MTKNERIARMLVVSMMLGPATGARVHWEAPLCV